MGIIKIITATGRTGLSSIYKDVKKASKKPTTKKYRIVKKPTVVGYKQIPRKVKGKWIVEKVPQIKIISKKVYIKKKKPKKNIKQFMMKEGVKTRRRPSISKTIKRTTKRKPIEKIRTGLGYNKKLNLGGLY